MRSWKVKTRAQHKARLYAWYESDAEHDHESKYVLSQIRLDKTGEHWSKGDRGHSRWEAHWSPIWRKNNWLSYRRDVQHVKDGLAKFAKYPYYEDCRYHVCRQLKVEQEGIGSIGVEGESLINGSWSNCSYEQCGILHLTKEEGEERVTFVTEMGMMPYQLKYVYGIPEDRSKLEARLRCSLGMERVWNFNKNSGTEEITDEGKAWLLSEVGIVYDDLKPMEEEEMEAARSAGG